MKKITYYLVFIIFIGVLTVSFWIYNKYIKDDSLAFLSYPVERGSIQETVNVRGEVVVLKEFELEFPFSGTVEKIYIAEGDELKAGSPLIKLETVDFELERKRLEALLSQSVSGLNKLIAGPTTQDINVVETQMENAKKTLDDANIALVNAKNKADSDLLNLYDDIGNIIQDAKTKAEDAVYKQADEMFQSPNSDSPKLIFLSNDAQARIDVESQRVEAGAALANIKKILSLNITDQQKQDDQLRDTLLNLMVVKYMLERFGDVLNSAVSLSTTTLNSYKTNINTSLTNINAVITAITSQQQLISAQRITNKSNIDIATASVNSAQSNLNLSEDNLKAILAGARGEDIEIAKSQIQGIRAQIDTIKEKINKATLNTPIAAKVAKIYLEKGEVFKPGHPVISMFSLGFKTQADVSELDIGKIKDKNGNPVEIKLDAFPKEVFSGKVLSIDPKEIIKGGDKYYRVNISLDESPFFASIRPGMSADMTVFISKKDDILKAPGIAVFEEDGKDFVRLLENQNEWRKVEVETGVSDGEYIEITKGLAEGDIVVVSTD